MVFTCLQDGLDRVSTQFSWVEKDDLFAMVLFSVFLALLLAPVVLALYQRRIEKLMSLSTRIDESALIPPSRTEGTKPAVVSGSAPSAEALLEAAEIGGNALWKALALSVTVFSLGISLAITVSPDSPGELSTRPLSEWFLNFLGYLLFVGSLSAPMVLLGVASARFSGLFWKRFAPVYVAILAVAMIFEDEMGNAERLETFGEGVVFLAVLYLALGGRRTKD